LGFLEKDNQVTWIPYSSVWAKAMAFVSKLQELPRGSLIAILGPNSVDFLSADLGVLVSGHVSVIMQETSDVEWLQEQLNMCAGAFADRKYDRVCGSKLLHFLNETWRASPAQLSDNVAV
jgi:acyl-CoA synthetase (AMP-forming)/AMP-acid ligase II